MFMREEPLVVEAGLSENPSESKRIIEAETCQG